MQPAGTFNVPAAHPCLPGHFPGRPIVPGVVLLDAVFAIVAGGTGRVAAVPNVKFLAPVLPGQEVLVSVGAAAGGTLAFACTVDGRDVLRGTLVMGARVVGARVVGARA